MEGKMKRDKRMIISLVWIVIGAVLIGLSFAGKVDEFWNGMGFALAVVGALQLLKYHRFNKNEAYREKMEIAETDERNHFIRGKAWAWTGYVFILIVALSSIVFKVIGQGTLCMAASGAVCLMLVLYWVSYMVLKRKY